MADKHVEIKQIKQSFSWHYLALLFQELYDNWGAHDKELEKKLADLLSFAQSKIQLPENSRNILDKYVIVEYEKII